MSEARTRPSRERMRYQQIVRANLWFWQRMRDADDQVWELIAEWGSFPDSMKIRRHNSHVPSGLTEEEDQTAQPSVAQGRTYEAPDNGHVNASYGSEPHDAR